ncbi:MAG: hypothetical protein IH612_20525 [Desulfofustis sp.]|nr:hypothetical protein [Desulfofustis sp.]
MEQPQGPVPEKVTGKKPKKAPAAENVAEPPRQGEPPKEQESSETSVNSQQETELTEEELELLRLQKEQEQEEGNVKGKSGKR